MLRNSEFGEARLGRVEVEVELSKVRRYARIEDAYIATPKVRAGDSIPIAVTIRTSDGGIVYRNETIQIPPDCPPGRVRVGVAGGRSVERSRSRLEISEPRPVSLTQMVQQMLKRPANDELVVDLALPTVGVEARGFAFRDLPPAVIDLLRSATASRLRTLRDYAEQRTKTEWVISGSVVLNLTVEGEEKDKTGRTPSPQYEPPRYDQVSGGFAELFFGSDYESTRTPSIRAAGVHTLRAIAGDAGADIDAETPPPMPSWEEVESIGETEIVEGASGEERKPAESARSEAIGRVASVWRVTDPRELNKGEAEGVALLSSGGIALAPRAEQLAQIDARCLWPVAVAPDGSAYTGTWTDGRVRRTAPDGKTAVVLETEAAGVQAITVDVKGTVYAATVPGGTIYRIPAGSATAEKLCDLGVQNVWALATTSDGSLWAATGPGGRLFRISAEGKAAVAFTAADRHITCLAVGPQDAIYLGTSPLGKVYAVPKDGPARAVVEVDRAAIQSIAVDASGVVFLGTSPEGRLLRVASSGAVEEVYRAKGKHVLALLAQPDGTVLAATGPEARVVALYPDKRSALLYEPNASYIAALTRDAAGCVYLTAADSGRLVKLDSVGPRTGSYLSAAHDGGSTTKWGAVRCSSAVPEGAEIALQVRSGGTSHPDQTWGDWQQVPLSPSSPSRSPTGRFLQFRMDLKASGAASPQLDALEISYLPANRPPEVVLSAPAGGEIWSGKQTVRWRGRDPDGDKLDYQVYWSSDRGQTWTKIEAPKQQAKPPKKGAEAGDQPKAKLGRENPAPTGPPAPAKPAPDQGRADSKPEPLAAGGVRLQGDDPSEIEAEIMRALEDSGADQGDGTELDGQTGEGEEAQVRTPAPRPSSTSLSWDTTKVPDGAYWLRVVANDARANPADPLTDEAVCRSLLVDNTPPELILGADRKADDAPPVSVSLFDKCSYVTSAEFKVDAGDWLAAMPQDGIFDGQYEVMLLDPARLPDGSHQLEIRARDAAGNAASRVLKYKK